MKVSLITICYNSAKTLDATIQSVLSQDFNEIEYIIKDGGSTDGTLSIIKKYENKLRWVSQSDKGIYDAMNQGLALASGDIIGLINSDDLYPDETVISRVVAKFKDLSIGAVYGDLQYVDALDTGSVKRLWIAGEYRAENFLLGWMPPHPSFFLRKTYYDQYGVFNPSFKSAGDYELMLRMLYKHQIKADYIPEIQMKMRSGGVSNMSVKNRIRANIEDRKAWEMNGIKPKWYTLWLKPISKILQWLS